MKNIYFYIREGDLERLTPLLAANRIDINASIKIDLSEIRDYDLAQKISKDDGLSPLALAAKYGNINIIEYLKEYGANYDYVTAGEVLRVVHCSAKCNPQKQQETMEYLLKIIGDNEIIDQYVDAALTYSLVYGCFGLTKRLLNCVSYEAKQKTLGKLFLDAVICKELEAVKFLTKEYEVDMKVVDDSGRNALHLAAAWNAEAELVQYLLDLGVNPKAIDSNGRTPLSIAEINVHGAPWLAGEGAVQITIMPSCETSACLNILSQLNLEGVLPLGDEMETHS